MRDLFEAARRERRTAFVPYVMAGDPDLETTGKILDELARAGVDAIELGIPYGDPLADGPTIAAAAARALQAGVKIDDVLALAKAKRGGPPIVLFTYYNPVYVYRLDRFARAAAEAGVAGAIVPDLSLEEAQPLREHLQAHGVAMPLLVAPSTPAHRAAQIAAESSGFVYVVSRLGVTGAGTAPDFTPVRAQVAALREVTDKPLAVGFGLSRPEQVREVAPPADGIIVGSALIDAYAGTDGAQAAQRVGAFVRPLIAAARA